jgi:hypothetical protein
MKKFSLMALFLLVTFGSYGEKIMKKPPAVCIPCQAYCKTHPDSPRCN